METVEAILTVIGAISIVIGIIRFIWAFFMTGTEWIDNIQITNVPWDDDFDPDDYFAAKGQAIYPYVFKVEEDKQGISPAIYFLVPQNTLIRNLQIMQLDPDSVMSGKEEYKKREKVKLISPEYPLCLMIDQGEAIAKYMIQWKTQYGGKATYMFYANLRDGAYDKTGIQYSFGVCAKIRKFFGLV